MCMLQINQLIWARLTSVCNVQRWLRWIAMVSHIYCDTRRSSCCTVREYSNSTTHTFIWAPGFNLTHIERLEKMRKGKCFLKGPITENKISFTAQSTLHPNYLWRLTLFEAIFTFSILMLHFTSGNVSQSSHLHIEVLKVQQQNSLFNSKGQREDGKGSWKLNYDCKKPWIIL